MLDKQELTHKMAKTEKTTVSAETATIVVASGIQNQKGHKKVGGRAKGTVNKTTKALKDMILGALELSGGETYLVEQARSNPTAFLTLIGKVLPTTLAGDPNQPLALSLIVGFRKPD